MESMNQRSAIVGSNLNIELNKRNVSSAVAIISQKKKKKTHTHSFFLLVFKSFTLRKAVDLKKYSKTFIL